MRWTKLRNDFASGAAFVEAGDAACLLYARAQAWSALNQTDGLIRAAVLKALRAKPGHAQALVSVGLWTEVDGVGWQHPWAEQEEAEDAETALAQLRDNGRRRKAKCVEQKRALAQLGANAGNVTGNVTGTTPERSERSESESESEKEEKQPPLPLVGAPHAGAPEDKKPKRAAPSTPIPADWTPTEEHRALAASRNVDFEAELGAFRAHAEATDRRAVRWGAAFTMWLHKAYPRRGVAAAKGVVTNYRGEVVKLVQQAPETGRTWKMGEAR